MKNPAITVAILLIISTLVSCESMIQIVPQDKLPPIEEQLVVSSFISPQDDTVRVYVSLSSPLFSENKTIFRNYSVINGDTTYYGTTPFVPDAMVQISNGSKTIKLSYNQQKEHYFFVPSAGTMLIEPNKTYELVVNYQDKTAMAKTTVPEMPIMNMEVKVDTFYEENVWNGVNLRVESVVSFATAWAGYYRIRGYSDGQSTRLQPNGQTNAYDEIVYNQSTQNYFVDNGIIELKETDQNKVIEIKGDAWFHSGSTWQNGQLVEVENKQKLFAVYNEVMYITEDYYKYYKSLSNYTDENPFAEATPIYGNISGGLGIFAASNRQAKLVKFE